MKNTFLFLFILTAVTLGASSTTSAQVCSPNQTQLQCGYYQEGYRDGANDARNYQSNDYKRYKNKYTKTYESYYRDGYQSGYLNAGIPTNGGGNYRWSSSQRSAYDSGYSIGQSDRRRSGSSRQNAPGLYGNYDASLGLYFQAGYDDGYANRSRRYDFNVGDNNGGGWGNGGWGGNSSGTATWSGRVDDRANIIIRGRSMDVQDVSATGLQTYDQRMTGSIGNRDTTVTANKRSGRGNVTVIQQPSRYNNYTAIIQIVDSRGGADDYRVDITWGGGSGGGSGWNGNETYRSGRVTWRGRVDQTANIRIDGSNVYTEDDSGTGLWNVRYDINGYLAHRPGTVNVRKRNGRGSVYVLQQPSWQNDFTAVIQVSDTGGGADDYEVEISW